MSGIVSFGEGGVWSVGRRGWNLLQELTCEKLRDAGHSELCGEVDDYGVAFDLQEDRVRVPLASALLGAAVELQAELSAAEGWDEGARGPYFGDLVAQLRREIGSARSDGPLGGGLGGQP